MKLVVFLAILAFASAKPYEILEQNTNEVGPFWQQFIPQPYRQFLPQEHWKQYWETYWPQEEGFQVAQYIAHQFFEAHQNGFTPAQFSLYLVKQGYPEPMVNYLAQEYEAFQTKLYVQSPYHTFQFYYDQRIPEEHFQWISQQLHHAYQQFPQYYYTKNGHQTFEQEYPYHSIAQFVNQQAYYYDKHGVSYIAAQNAYQQLQQVEEYVQNAFEYLKNNNVPKEIYQYLFQELQQGQQYVQLAQNVDMSYQNLKVNYIPYYAAMYISEQIHHAYEHFHNVYQFVYQQQALGHWPQDAQFFLQQIQFVYQTIKNAYKVYYYYPYDTTHYTPSYEHQYSEQYPWNWNMNSPKTFTGKYFNKDVELEGDLKHDEKLQFVPYSPSLQYGYQYMPKKQLYESYGTQYPSIYQYGPYEYGYHGFNFNQWNKPYQYGSYKPTYPYNYWNSQVAVAA